MSKDTTVREKKRKKREEEQAREGDGKTEPKPE